MITPLILAAKYQRKEIIAKLLKNKARPSSKDFLERSALFYASRNGDLSSVKALLQAGAPVDDGSLNEAARELHDDVVKALIKKGHTVDSRSTNKDHDHRTALEEMLLKCDGNAGLSKIEDTLRTLTKGKPTDKDFFMALNNPAPITLVKALLSIGMKQPLIKGDLLLTESVDEFIYSYSPTMYIRHGLCSSPVEMQDELLAEIRGNGGVDQFNAQEIMVQPSDYTGAHPSVRLAEEQRSYDREADISSLPRSSRQKRRKEYEAEDRQWAFNHAAAREELRRQAEEKRRSTAVQVQMARQQQQTNLEFVREQQHRLNFQIQQGDANDRRQYFIRRLTERRHDSFLRGIDSFSENERRIAGWDNL
jgi:hypothetical protein